MLFRDRGKSGLGRENCCLETGIRTGLGKLLSGDRENPEGADKLLSGDRENPDTAGKISLWRQGIRTGQEKLLSGDGENPDGAGKITV